MRLDDQFTEHPKVVEAGPLAAWLYVCGLTYCARQLTDGFIPAAQLPRLTSGPVGKLAARLVAVGLWEPADGGYRVHDYLDYQPSRDEVEEARQQVSSARSAAGRLGGLRSGQVRRSKTASKIETNAKQKGSPVPIPIPCITTGGKPPIGDEPSPRPVRAVPKPSKDPAAGALHQALFASLVERFRSPANDAERGRYARAVTLLTQAGVSPEEIAVLADALEERWPNAECTPLAIASNVTTLRGPVKAAPRSAPPSKLAQTAANLRQLKALQEANGDERTSFFALATAGVGLPDAGGGRPNAGALPGPPGGPALA